MMRLKIPRPSIGRVVHYCDPSGELRAGVIVGVHPATVSAPDATRVDVFVFPSARGKVLVATNVPFGDGTGTWKYPMTVIETVDVFVA